MTAAIIVPCYNRPKSVARLLAALANARYPSGDITLIVSIDRSDTAAVEAIAESFNWPHGDKRVLKHAKRMGLRQHLLYCGDQSSLYGQVIVLEDDLFISPAFYSFACEALTAYAQDSRIAGVSLYSDGFNETAWRPFRPLDDGEDVYFMQYPSSWGQAWTKEQWSGFREWEREQQEGKGDDMLPANVRKWSGQSWKKAFARYMIECGKYFVYPRRSWSTNFGESGQHLGRQTRVFQVPLLAAAMQCRFTSLDESGAVYDAYHEILPRCLKRYNKSLESYDFTVDLYGTKEVGQISTPHILTTRPTRGSAMGEFANDLVPSEANVAFNVPGSDITLCPTTDLAKFNFVRRAVRESERDLPGMMVGRGAIYICYLAVAKGWAIIKRTAYRLYSRS